MIILLPWLQLEQETELDGVAFAPIFPRFGELHTQLQSHESAFLRLLSAFKDFENETIRYGTFLHRASGGSSFTDADARDSAALTGVLFLGCFALNEYCAHGQYLNAAAFQSFRTGFAPSLEISVERLDRDYPLLGEPGRHIRFHQPVQTALSRPTRCDEHFSAALNRARRSRSKTWMKVATALPFFQQATLDDPSMPLSTKIILMVAAYEHLVVDGSKKLAKKLAELLAPYGGSHGLGGIRSRSNIIEREITSKPVSWLKNGDPLHKGWIFELHRMRSRLIHPNTLSAGDLAWPPNDHLLIAAHLFPLLIKLMLEGEGIYELSDSDRNDLFALDERLSSVDLREQWLPCLRKAVIGRALRSGQRNL